MAVKNVEYVLSLTDRASGPLGKITGASEGTLTAFNNLATKNKIFQSSFKDLGGSISTLRQRLDLLKAEKDLINPNNLKQIKQYNREIDRLSGKIDKLDNTGRGGLKGYLSQIGGAMGGFLTNPITIATTGIGMAVKQAMSFDENMAKVNITAQLDEKGLAGLKDRVRDIVDFNKADMSTAPIGLEKIISQTGDVDLSLSILDSTLRGSKAGFTDMDTVAGALAQTLSIVGKENANASEVLDTFFAAKRVGAGEFKDFAQYMPNLIAGGSSLGLAYQEVAGIFAYMTGKGQSAEKSAVLMENAFSALGKSDIQKGLQKFGVEVFDSENKMRSLVDISRDLNKVLPKAGEDDKKRGSILEQIGLRDKEAKSAFMIMTSDVGKFAESMDAVKNSTGETDAALELSANSAQRARELWNSLKNTLTDFGVAILPIVNSGIMVLGGVLEVLTGAISVVLGAFSWWYEMLTDGNPIIWGLTAALGAIGVALVIHKYNLMQATTWTTLMSVAKTKLAVVTGVLSGALKVLKAALITSGVGIAVLAIGVAVGVMAALSGKTDAATKSFAAFNSELRKSQDEAKGSFTAAIMAADGSEARATAIAKINTQYGTYLPALLTEKTTNDELSAALDLVNGQLERKLRNKFRDQAMEGAMKELDEAQTEFFENALKKVPENAQVEVAKGLRSNLSLFEAGGIDKLEFGDRISDVLKPHIPDRAYLDRSGLIAGILTHNYSAALDEFKGEELIIKAQYTEPAPKASPPPQTVINNFNGLPFSSDALSGLSLQSAKPFKFGSSGTDVLDATAGNPSTGANGVNPNDDATKAAAKREAERIAALAGLGGGGGYTPRASNVFDLDKVTAVNEKGTGAYGAIMSRVKMAGLTTAASIGLGVASPALTNAATLPTNSATEMPSVAGDTTDYNDPNRQKTLNLDKFCDQIVIHIANADGKGYDQVREEVINVLMEVVDGQE